MIMMLFALTTATNTSCGMDNYPYQSVMASMSSPQLHSADPSAQPQMPVPPTDPSPGPTDPNPRPPGPIPGPTIPSPMPTPPPGGSSP